MLVLTRRPGETLQIGDDIEIKVVAVQGNRVRLAIDAPREVSIRRPEAPRPRGRKTILVPGTSTLLPQVNLGG